MRHGHAPRLPLPAQIWALEHHGVVSEFIPDAGIYPVLTAGVVLTAIGVGGIWGVCAKKGVLRRCFLIAYGLIISVLIIAEMGGAIGLFVATGDIHDFKFENQVHNGFTRVVNQTYFDCCNATTHVPLDPAPNCGIPDATNLVTDADCASQSAWTDAVGHYLRTIIIPVAIASVTLAVIQTISLCAVCYVAGRARAAANKPDARGTWSTDTAYYGSDFAATHNARFTGTGTAANYSAL